eukprot:SAG31_NODE_32176_length_359_cov_0.657692_1_plen_40_part_01
MYLLQLSLPGLHNQEDHQGKVNHLPKRSDALRQLMEQGRR